MLLLPSCVKFEGGMVDVKELAPAEKYVILEANQTEGSALLYSNGHCTLKFAEAYSWLSLSAMEFDGDATITVNCSANKGTKRMAKVYMQMEGLRDSFYVRQMGEEEFLRFASEYQLAPGSEATDYDPGMEGNVPPGRIATSVSYTKGQDKDWVEKVELSPEGCKVSLKANPSNMDTRSADIAFSWVDSWEEQFSLVLHLTQKTSFDALGQPVSFKQVRNADGLLNMQDRRYVGNYVVEGVVISDCADLNVATAPNVTYNSVDLSENARTMYLQELTPDGGGICFKWSDPESNTISRGTRLIISLDGLTLKDMEAPGLTIMDLKPGNILEMDPGAEIPLRIRKISELSDDDLNTWVTIPEAEFVFKQGAYSNVREAYQLKSDLNEGVKNVTNAVDASARLLCDSEGGAIFMQINSKLPWRRRINSGAEGLHGVPRGVGSVSGILVDEPNPRYGSSIGRYSLRPREETDIAIEEQDGTGRQLIAEWIFDHRNPSDVYARSKGYEGRVYQWQGEFKSGNTAAMSAINKMRATSGDASALLYCTNVSWPVDKVYTVHGTSTGSNSNQIYTNIINNRPLFADGYENPYVWGGSDWGVEFKGVWKAADDVMNSYRSDGRGVYHYCGCSDYSNYIWVTNLSGWYEWDADVARGEKGFVVELPSTGGGPLLLAFSIGAGGYPARQWNMLYSYDDGFYNTTSGYYAQNYPLYWKVEYSTDGGGSWNDDAVESTTGENVFKMLPIPWWSAAVYADPTTGVSSGTAYINAETCPGLVEHLYRLPAVSGPVMIRIVPASTIVATLSVGEGNFRQPLDKGVRITKDASHGNMIHIGGIRVMN